MKNGVAALSKVFCRRLSACGSPSPKNKHAIELHARGGDNTPNSYYSVYTCILLQSIVMPIVQYSMASDCRSDPLLNKPSYS